MMAQKTKGQTIFRPEENDFHRQGSKEGRRRRTWEQVSAGRGGDSCPGFGSRKRKVKKETSTCPYQKMQAERPSQTFERDNKEKKKEKPMRRVVPGIFLQHRSAAT